MLNDAIFRGSPPRWIGALAAAVILVSTGCGIIADKQRIRIAKVGGDYITRGDLEQAIRDMPAEERPQIRTKGDLRNALEVIIDNRIKQGQAAALKAQGKINVSRELAELAYIARYPEKYRDYLQVRNLISEQDAEFYEEERQMGIDREQERLSGEQAIAYLINDAASTGAMTVTEEQYQELYNLRKGQLLTHEAVAIRGVYFPMAAYEGEDVYKTAVDAMTKLGEGGDPQVIAETAGPDKAGYLEVGLENTMSNIKFASFWERASGTSEGAIVGPVPIVGWVRKGTNASGEAVEEVIPDALLVCRVVQHNPSREMTLEEAKNQLQASILYSQMMERLRTQAGVEIYDDKIPDPSIYDGASASSVLSQ